MNRIDHVGIAGAGTMGSGIAQVAATAGHRVTLFDPRKRALDKARSNLDAMFQKLQGKGKLDKPAKEVLARISFSDELNALSKCDMVIEAIVEDLPIKQELFRELEKITGQDTILATNTSSLSVTSIAGALDKSERVIGLHFFNPAPLMPLVEVVPAVQTSQTIIETSKNLMTGWKKKPVLARDTPGFIVNRVARPFYGEALRIFEEGLASMEDIDQSMRDAGFRMGPFELMDYIGNDVNYAVTETVFREFYFDPRYRPAFTQKRMVEAGRLGRKSGRGYYDYTGTGVTKGHGQKKIADRILSMLINEAADALYLNIASREDLDTAMTQGVNYPKGLLAWADEIGPAEVLRRLDELYQMYCEDRYRPSPLLRRMVQEGKTFYTRSDATA